MQKQVKTFSDNKKVQFVKSMKGMYGKQILLYQQPNRSVIHLTSEETQAYHTVKHPKENPQNETKINLSTFKLSSEPINLTKMQQQILQKMKDQEDRQSLRSYFQSESSTNNTQCQKCKQKKREIKRLTKLNKLQEKHIQTLKTEKQEQLQIQQLKATRKTQESKLDSNSVSNSNISKISKQSIQITKMPQETTFRKKSKSQIYFDQESQLRMQLSFVNDS